MEATVSPPPELSAATLRLMATHPVFDAHCDSIGRALDLGHDLGQHSEDGHFDLVRGRAGGLGSWVIVCWVEPDLYLPRSFERAAQMLGAAHDLADRHPDKIRLVGNGSELARAHADGVVAGIPGIEGGHAIEDSLENLRWFHGRGLRVMTLVWNNHLSWIRSCQDGAGAGVPAGLSPLGRDVVRTMNELGMVVDLSHAGVRSFYDALETSEQPLIASHSACHALHDHPRNLTDDQLRALADHGGVAGIVFHPPFLDAEARADQARVRETPSYTGICAASPAQRFLEEQRIIRAKAAPLPAERLVQHVVHAVEVMGIDHVGLGSDFDGIERGPQWMEDATGYPVLCELLLRRGFSPGDVRKVLGGNMQRIFAAVTAGR